MPKKYSPPPKVKFWLNEQTYILHPQWAEYFAQLKNPPESFHPIAVHSSAFIPSTDNTDWSASGGRIQMRTGTGSAIFYAPLFLPNGVKVSKLTLYGYCDDALATMKLELRRSDRAGSTVEMATINCNWTSGYSSLADTSINNAVIDNDTYDYYLGLTLNPNDAPGDVRLSGAKIEF